MNKMKNVRKKIIHSPAEAIPLGEPSLNESGQAGLNVQRKDSSGKVRSEFVTLDYINSAVIKAVVDKS